MRTTRNTKAGKTQERWTDGVRRSMTYERRGYLRQADVENEILLLHCTVSKSVDECVN